MSEANSSVTRQSVAEEVYSEIRTLLLSGGISPGQRLSEPELALKFRASRSPVREALMKLELEGFVERQPNGRVVVKPLEIADLKQLYELRASLEGLAARITTPLLRTVDLETMSGMIDQMSRCVRNGDPEGALAAGRDFHDVLTQECPNKLLVEVLRGLRARISRYRAIVASLGNYDQERVTEHRRIIKAFYERAPEAAEKEVIKHVERAGKSLVKKLSVRVQK